MTGVWVALGLVSGVSAVLKMLGVLPGDPTAAFIIGLLFLILAKMGDAK